MKSVTQVTVTLEVTIEETWQASCTLAQVMNDAQRTSRERVRRMLDGQAGVRLVGEVKVVSAITGDA